MSEFKYRAFISYSSRDRKIGEKFQRALESYKVPRKLRGRKTDFGKVPKRVTPIWRDRSDLDAHHSLGAKINEALENSATLIVLCSPYSASSQWVNQEIKTFKHLGRKTRIVAVLVDGDPTEYDDNSNPAGAFPPALLRQVDKNGELASEYEVDEPFTPDLREPKSDGSGGDGFNNVIEKVVAALTGIPQGELSQSHEEAERRERIVQRWITVGAIMLTICSIAGGGSAFLQSQDAMRSQSVLLANVSSERSQLADSISAGVLSLYALPTAHRAILDRPIVAPALSSLYGALRYHSLEAAWKAHDGALTDVDFHSSGSLLATGSDDGSFSVWRFSDQVSLWSKSLERKAIQTVEFGPEGETLLILTSDLNLSLWSSTTGAEITPPPSRGGGYISASFGINDSTLLTTTRDGHVFLWEFVADKWNPIALETYEPDTLRSSAVITLNRRTQNLPVEVRLSAQRNKALIYRLGSNEFSEWDLIKQRQLHIYTVEGQGGIEEIVPSADGTFALVKRFWGGLQEQVLDGGPARQFLSDEIPPGQSLETGFTPSPSSTVLAIAVSIDGSVFVTSNAEGMIQIWDRYSGATRFSFKVDSLSPRHLDLSSNAQTIYGTGPEGATFAWDAKSGTALAFFAEQGARKNALAHYALVNEKAGVLFKTSRDGYLRAWRTNTPPYGADILRLTGTPGRFSPADYNASLNLVAVATSDTNDKGRFEHSVRIVDIAEQKTQRDFDVAGQVASLRLSSNGHLTASLRSGQVIVWDVDQGRVLVEKNLPAPAADAQTVCNGSILITTSWDGFVRSYDMESHQLIREVSLAESPRRFATDCKTKLVYVSTIGGGFIEWNFENGELRELYRQTEFIRAISMTPSGNILATGSEDKSVVLWSAADNKIIDRLTHSGSLVSLAFSEDGSRLVTVEVGGKIRVYRSNESQRWVIEQQLDSMHLTHPIGAFLTSNQKVLITLANERSIRVWPYRALSAEELIARVCGRVAKAELEIPHLTAEALPYELKDVLFAQQPKLAPCDRHGLLSISYYKQVYLQTLEQIGLFMSRQR